MGAEGKSEDFVIARVFDAPRERLWEVLTQAEHLKEWWSPTGFTMIAANIDLRPGGVFHCGLRAVDGYKMWGKFVYREIVPPERLVFVNSFSNAAGGVSRHPIVPTWPMETLITVTFEDEGGGKSKLNVRWAAHNANEVEQKTFDASHVGMKATWTGTLDRLGAYLAKP
ncbi:MAG: SRPBCC domain-containing protein [Xanthobacteraceae bacterium]